MDLDLDLDAALDLKHSHNFLGDDHSSKEWRTWAVIILCSLSMVVEITCGVRFGSLALVADGIHMSTHALAFFITASAYSFSRVHANNPKYVFGTGKIGELASFTCAIILLAISCVIIYEGINQLIHPIKLDFIPALVVSFVGLSVNIASAFLLGLACGPEGEDINHHSHGHGHGHSHGHSGHEFMKDFDDEDDEDHHGHDHGHDAHADHDHHDHGGHDHGHGHDHCETFDVQCARGTITFSIFEDGVPPEFRIVVKDWQWAAGAVDWSQLAGLVSAVTTRPDGRREEFRFEPLLEENCLHSTAQIPEPHEFQVELVVRQPLPSQSAADRFSFDFREDHDDHSDGHGHGYGHGHEHHDGHEHGHHHEESFAIKTTDGIVTLSIFEEGVPPEFRLTFRDWKSSLPSLFSLTKKVTVTTLRANGQSQVFTFREGEGCLRSLQPIPEPHDFHVELRLQSSLARGTELYSVDFHEPESGVVPQHDEEEDEDEDFGHHHGHSHKKRTRLPTSDQAPGQGQQSGTVSSPSKKARAKKKYEQDNNFRAALLHVAADAFVSVITIAAIAIAGTVPGAWFLNPAAGILGSLVIISWGLQLVYDTAGTLLDISPDDQLDGKLRAILEKDGQSRVVDLHVWKLGPGRLGLIASVATTAVGRERDFYWEKLRRYKALAHVTIEIHRISSLSGKNSTINALHKDQLLLDDHDDHDHSHGHGHGHEHSH